MARETLNKVKCLMAKETQIYNRVVRSDKGGVWCKVWKVAEAIVARDDNILCVRMICERLMNKR
jgi:hypothetical protein